MAALLALLLGLAVPPLLPDLDQAPPQAISIVERDRHRLLVFASAVDNVGPGELEVEARRADGAMRAAPDPAAMGTAAAALAAKMVVATSP